MQIIAPFFFLDYLFSDDRLQALSMSNIPPYLSLCIPCLDQGSNLTYSPHTSTLHLGYSQPIAKLLTSSSLFHLLPSTFFSSFLPFSPSSTRWDCFLVWLYLLVNRPAESQGASLAPPFSSHPTCPRCRSCHRTSCYRLGEARSLERLCLC